MHRIRPWNHVYNCGEAFEKLQHPNGRGENKERGEYTEEKNQLPPGLRPKGKWKTIAHEC